MRNYRNKQSSPEILLCNFLIFCLFTVITIIYLLSNRIYWGYWSLLYNPTHMINWGKHINIINN